MVALVSQKVFYLKRRVDNNGHQLEDYLRQTESFEQQFKELKIKSDQLSELYFEKSQKHNTLKEQVHHFEMELDRLTTQETQIKNDHEEFEFEKMMVIRVTKVDKLLSEKTHLESIKASLKRLEDEIERYTKLLKKVRKRN